MASYDIVRLHSELANLSLATSATRKGKRLQDLVEYLFDSILGVTVFGRNVVNAARSEEKDLWVRHDFRLSGLPCSDVVFPVECKNEERPASAEEIATFARKIRDSGGADGVFVATAGLAGKGTAESAHHQVGVELSHGVRIIILVGADLMLIRTAEDVVNLLIERHVELRTKQTYEAI